MKKLFGGIVALAMLGSAAMTGDVVAAATPAARLDALAVQQSKLWADAVVGDFDSPLAPAGCSYAQPVSGVFLLPVNTGLGDPPVTVTCQVPAGTKVLADLGGVVPFEDANGTDRGYELASGEVLPFAPDTLVTICTDIMAQGFVPAPDVTLDGKRPRSKPEVVITGTFRYITPSAWLLENDSAELGHPGTLTGSYCGYKLLLEPLSVGPHVLVGSAFGRPITWNVQVVPRR